MGARCCADARGAGRSVAAPFAGDGHPVTSPAVPWPPPERIRPCRGRSPMRVDGRSAPGDGLRQPAVPGSDPAPDSCRCGGLGRTSSIRPPKRPILPLVRGRSGGVRRGSMSHPAQSRPRLPAAGGGAAGQAAGEVVFRCPPVLSAGPPGDPRRCGALAKTPRRIVPCPPRSTGVRPSGPGSGGNIRNPQRMGRRDGQARQAPLPRGLWRDPRQAPLRQRAAGGCASYPAAGRRVPDAHRGAAAARFGWPGAARCLSSWPCSSVPVARADRAETAANGASPCPPAPPLPPCHRPPCAAIPAAALRRINPRAPKPVYADRTIPRCTRKETADDRQPDVV